MNKIETIYLEYINNKVEYNSNAFIYDKCVQQNSSLLFLTRAIAVNFDII